MEDFQVHFILNQLHSYLSFPSFPEFYRAECRVAPPHLAWDFRASCKGRRTEQGSGSHQVPIKTCAGQ